MQTNEKAEHEKSEEDAALAGARAAFPNNEGNYRRRVKVPPTPPARVEGYEDLPERVYEARRAARPRNMNAAAAMLAMLSLGGCATTADALKNLGDDHAAVRVESVTPWGGTVRISRVNPGPGQSAEIAPDGTIRAGGVAK